MPLLLFADFFSKLAFQKILSGTLPIRMSNSLEPDQDRHFVGPNLDLNCLQRLSADNKNSCHRTKPFMPNEILPLTWSCSFGMLYYTG